MIINRKASIRRAASGAALTLLAVVGGMTPAKAGTLTQKDVQILAKAIGFLEPQPSGAATVAIAYDPADPVSKLDADAIASYFGEGLKAGTAVLQPKIIDVGQLSSGSFVAVVAATGAKMGQVSKAAQALHVACVTADATAVQAGECVMSVRFEPKVEIQVNHAAATSSGVAFGSAFLLMAHTI